jgi:hypothetical protein
MTVEELILALQELDPKALVVMSKDAEGNNFSPLSEVEREVAYIPDSTYSGSILNPLDEDYYGEDWSDMLANSIGSVCLWPVN